jgi:hypothetical protein
MTAWRWWWTPKGSDGPAIEVEVIAWLESFVVILGDHPAFNGQPVYAHWSELRAERITR